MGSSSKRQTTMAKFAREQRLKERRALKQERKDTRKQVAADDSAVAHESPPTGEPADGSLGG